MSQPNWTRIIGRALAKSVPAAEKRITSHPEVQAWLQDASYEAAAGLMGAAGRSGMDAYHQLSNDFEREFGSLRVAVDELTCGCGQAVVSWEPGDPQQTTIRIDFRQDFPVHVFESVDAAAEAPAAQFLERLSGFLPKGAPFPKKPHRVGGVLAASGDCVGVRLVEVISPKDEREKHVSLYTAATAHEQPIPYDDAAKEIAELLGIHAS